MRLDERGSRNLDACWTICDRELSNLFLKHWQRLARIQIWVPAHLRTGCLKPELSPHPLLSTHGMILPLFCKKLHRCVV